MGQITPQPLTDRQIAQLLNTPGCADARLRRTLEQVQQALQPVSYLGGSVAFDPVTNTAYWNGGNTFAPITQNQDGTIINEQASPRPLLAMTLTSDMSGGTATASLTDYFGPSPTDLNVTDTYGLFPYALSGDAGLFQYGTDGQTLSPVLLNSRAWYSGQIQSAWDGTGTIDVQTGRPRGMGFFTPTCKGYMASAFAGGKELTDNTVVVIVWDFFGPTGGAAGWYVLTAYDCPN